MHTYHEALDALESGNHLETVESQDDLEESSAGYEVVVQHKELRGTASVFFERSSCYAYVDIDAYAVDCGPAPYEVRPITLVHSTYAVTRQPIYTCAE